MSLPIGSPREVSPDQPHALQATPLTTVLRPRESRRDLAILRPIITVLILIFVASLIIRGIEIRISDITISLGR